jgi:hypothetical protein
MATKTLEGFASLAGPGQGIGVRKLPLGGVGASRTGDLPFGRNTVPAGILRPPRSSQLGR